MDMRKYLFIVLVMLISGCGKESPEKKWTTNISENGLEITLPGTPYKAVFKPQFMVLIQDEDPEMALRPGNVPGVSYNVVSWENKALNNADLLAEIKRDEAQYGDGFDARILEATTQKRTADAFKSGRKVLVEASEYEQEGTLIRFSFPDDPLFALSATIDVDPALPFPKLTYAFTPKEKKYFSVVFVGAPAISPDEASAIWQPMLWQEKRFPHQPFLTMAYRCPLPTTLVCESGACLGVVATPEEFPFMPLPMADNSRFGIAVRNEEGMAQPTLFAPVMGGMDSHMEAGRLFDFSAYLFLGEGSDTETYEEIARDIYQFRDYRNNAVGPLNTALDNMIDYGMSDYSWFVDSLKGCAYSTDVPGAVKNVSSLNPLQIALLTDRKDIFDQRAYPIMEYLLSREKFLFSLDPEQKIQSPSRNMTGPSAPLSELTTLFEVSDRHSPVFLKLAKDEYAKDKARNLDKIERGDRWQNALALYEATGDSKYLETAVNGAKKYLKARQDSFIYDFTTEPAGYFFWPTFTNDWINLLRLYEASGEETFLQAAREGARHYTQFTWLSPQIPDGDILVNEGGMAPMYWYLEGKGHIPMEAAEETVPAWRLSAIGLTPESSGTCNGHRGIFMANYAPWMLRIAHYTGDMFLRDVARSAVIGRYTNFPGYHINTARTTVYEKPNYPLRPFKELSVNSMHFNHIWPHMSILVDYLMSDALLKSDGAIHFPGDLIEGYAYLQSQFYGHKPGTFYDIEDAVPWMPQGLLETSSPQLNYIAARTSEGLVLAFMNQADTSVTSTISLRAEAISIPSDRSYDLFTWKKGQRKKVGQLVGGQFEVDVPADGLTPILIKGLSVPAKFQDKLLDNAPSKPWVHSFQEVEPGRARALMLQLGTGLEKAFFYSTEDDQQWTAFELLYRTSASGDVKILTDNTYPYEFTIDLPANTDSLSYRLKGRTISGRWRTGDWQAFQKEEPTSSTLK